MDPENADTIKVPDPPEEPARERGVPTAHDTSDLTTPRKFPGGALPSGIHETGALGRFNILDILGAGGMGIVLAAYDPQLDRKVAIKVLRTRGMSQRKREKEAARLLREARALAQLSHPHVVTVFDAGTVDDHVFIAMEYIAGQTLRAWINEAPRAVDEILDVYLKAGSGIAAGHAVGVIHRDFKPDNVLVGRDGRVRVIDFGLAQPAQRAGTSDEADSTDDATPAPASPPSAQVTTAGALFGTPSYMAPEQHDRGVIDGRTDQFAFCVALYEALYRRMPFDGATYYELVANVTSGELKPPPDDPAVPKRVQIALGRGLARDPAARFPSMDALLAALAPPRSRRGRALAGAGVAAVAAATITFLAVRSDAPAPTCDGGEERLAGVWDASVRARVLAGLSAASRSHARATSEIVAGELDRYADAWTSSRRQICKATEIDHERSVAVFDLGMRCLAERLEEVRALVAVFAEKPDPAVADRAVAAVRKLAAPSTCADVMPGAYPPAAPDVQPAIDDARTRAAALRALQNAGRFAAAATELEKLIPEAAKAGYPPLDAELQYQLAQAYHGASRAADAEKVLREAIRIAAIAKDDRLTARAYTLLVGVIGFTLARYDEAIALEPVAAERIARADGGDAMTADLAYYVGTAHFQKGEYALAEKSFRAALAARVHLFGNDHPDVAQVHNSLGGTLLKMGLVESARDELELAVSIRERVLGPKHPDVGLPLANLGALANVTNDFAAAERYYARAAPLLEDVLGPDHVNVALMHVNIGALARDRKACDVAVAESTRAIAILEKLGTSHPFLVNPLVVRGHCRVDQSVPTDAIADASRAIAIASAQGGDPAQLAQARFVHARALWETGEHDKAKALAEQARAALADGGRAAASALTEVTDWQKAHP